jgi:quercetin dioxygenase-like cupin family protein
MRRSGKCAQRKRLFPSARLLSVLMRPRSRRSSLQPSLLSSDLHLRLFRADRAEPMRFGDVDARWLIGAETAGATAIAFGTATYAPGTAIERHYHPNAEEVVLVISGSALHEVSGNVFKMEPGDVCFIPRGEPHSLACFGEQTLKIVWAWGGAASVEAAGFVAASD